MYRLMKGIAATFVRLFFPFKVIGKENLCKGPCVVVSNHLSNADGFLIGMQFKERITILAKKESFSSKPVAWFLRTLGAVPIDRDNPDAATVINCIKSLKKGGKVLIFPEGTRNKTAEPLLPIKGGAALLSLKSKVPVQTVYIYGKSKLFRRNFVKIGEPFEFTELYDTKVNAEIIERADEVIRQKLLETRELPVKKGK